MSANDTKVFQKISEANRYSLSKTLRFELKPMVFNDQDQLVAMPEADSRIENFTNYLQEVIKEDEQRALDYQDIKFYIDVLHKEFISEALAEIKLNLILNKKDFDKNKVLKELEKQELNLECAFSLYQSFKKKYPKISKNDVNHEEQEKSQKKEKEEHKKNWEEFQKELRKKISSLFQQGDLKDKYEKLYGKELFKVIKEKLNFPEKEITGKTPKELAENFSKFTTYFKGFEQNRKNMYAAKGSTAIAHRLINDNLPKFFTNIINFRSLEKNHPDLIQDFKNVHGEELIEKNFTIENFKYFLDQAGVDQYNELIEAKKKTEAADAKKGLRQIVNEYKQRTGIKEIANFYPFYNQILGAENKLFIKEIKEDKEIIESLSSLYENIKDDVNNIIKTLSGLRDKDPENIFILASERESLSHKLFGDFGLLKKVLKYYFIESHIDDKRKKESPLEKKSEDDLRKRKIYSIAEIEAAIKFYKDNDNEFNFDQSLLDYFSHVLLAKTAGDNSNKSIKPEQIVFTDALEGAWEVLRRDILTLEYIDKEDRSIPNEKNKYLGGTGFQQIEKIKQFLDIYMELLHFAKPLYLVHEKKMIEVKGDEDFYSSFNSSYEKLRAELLGTYNKTRNYLTKKPYSKDKIKINFQKGTLLKGWDVNKEDTNLGVLLIKDDNYYLGIMKNNRLFDFKHKTKGEQIREKAVSVSQGVTYKKVMYKQFDPVTDLPHKFFAESNKDIFNVPDEINSIRKTSSFTKDGKPQDGCEKAEFKLEDCHKMIDFYKKSIKKHEDWSNFTFNFKKTSEYSDISEFYADIDPYKINFIDIKEDYINSSIKNDDLVLFQIYNKDFSKNKKRLGTPNLHTIYFKEVFHAWLTDRKPCIKLNGEAEIFFRKASLPRKITHPAKKAIARKNHLKGETAINEFDYDLIKDRRYTVDKFFFHVPITLNYQSRKKKVDKVFNEDLNSFLIENKQDLKIIGIDRGERNLLYYSVIDQNGNIQEQGSFNTIVSEYQTDKSLESNRFNYQNALHKKEKERDEARKSWGTIENIKELKSGYLSHVVHKIALLVLKHNAVICLEDLNSGFKRTRLKIEKQVYQNFELALVKKLGNLVLKKDYLNDNQPIRLGELGSETNPYQLSYEVTNYKDIDYQTGIVFFLEPSYTSKICPRTGFVNFLNLTYGNETKAKELISEFNRISFNSEAGYFEFDLDFKKFTQTKAKECGVKTDWIVCTYGDIRYEYDSISPEKVNEVDVTRELKELLDKEEIDYTDGLDLRERLLEKSSVPFCKKLFRLIGLTMTLRHSLRLDDDGVKDFILSPIKGRDGEFFESEKLLEAFPVNEEGVSEAKEPIDADANGAYHIAMKGLLIFQERLLSNKPNLTIKKEDWFRFIQNHHETKWKEKSLSPI